MVPEHYNGGGKDCFTQNDSWLEKPWQQLHAHYSTTQILSVCFVLYVLNFKMCFACICYGFQGQQPFCQKSCDHALGTWSWVVADERSTQHYLYRPFCQWALPLAVTTKNARLSFNLLDKSWLTEGITCMLMMYWAQSEPIKARSGRTNDCLRHDGRVCIRWSKHGPVTKLTIFVLIVEQVASGHRESQRSGHLRTAYVRWELVRSWHKSSTSWTVEKRHSARRDLLDRRLMPIVASAVLSHHITCSVPSQGRHDLGISLPYGMYGEYLIQYSCSGAEVIPWYLVGYCT
jgi:hypothetical protein